MVYAVSNYQQIERGEEEAEASTEVSILSLPPAPKREIRIVTGGVHAKLAEYKAISAAIKQHEMKKVKALCVKALKNRAFSAQGKGTVGSSAQWVALGSTRDEIWCGLDVVGGTVAQETPNLINIGAQVELGGNWIAHIGGAGSLVRDTYVGDEAASTVGKYDQEQERFMFFEPKCGICGTPWPMSQKSCEACLADRASKK